MRKGRNKYAILSCLLLGSMLFGGCGGQTVSTSDTAGSSDSSVSTAVSVSESPAASSGSAPSESENTVSSASSVIAASETTSQSGDTANEEVLASSAVKTESVSADSASGENPEEQKAQLLTLFDTVADLQPGTSGSSLRTAAATSELCDFCSETTLDDETLKTAVTDYLSAKYGDDSTGLKLYQSAFSGVEEQYKAFIDSSEDESGLLSDAGVTDSGYPYNYQDIEKMDELCSTVAEFVMPSN